MIVYLVLRRCGEVLLPGIFFPLFFHQGFSSFPDGGKNFRDNVQANFFIFDIMTAHIENKPKMCFVENSEPGFGPDIWIMIISAGKNHTLGW